MRKWSCQSRQTTCCTSHGGNYSFPPYLTPTLSLTKSGESDSPDQVLKSIHAKSPWRIDGGVWGWWRAKHKGPLGPTLNCVNMTLLNCVQSTSSTSSSGQRSCVTTTLSHGGMRMRKSVDVNFTPPSLKTFNAICLTKSSTQRGVNSPLGASPRTAGGSPSCMGSEP